MKIFIVARGCPNERNHLLGIFEFEQAKVLSDLGHEVIYLSLDLRSIRRKRPLGYRSYIKKGVRIEEYSFPIGAVPKKVFINLGEKVFRKLLKKVIEKYGKPDVIHAHFLDIATIVSKSKLDDIPFVITEHSSQLNRNLTSSEIKLYKDVYSRADKVITVSKDLRKRIKQILDIDSICINNMINLTKFSYMPKFEKDNFVITTIASLDNNKRVELVIEAIKKIIDDKKINNIQYNVIGQGPNRTDIEYLINKYNLKKNVKLWGVITKEEINEILHDTNCFVLASVKETFGVACAEALYTGTPVVVTKCGGPEEFVDETNGVIVDDDSLVEGIMAIYNNYDSYDFEEISKTIEYKFSEEVIAKQIEDVYREVLLKRKGYE